MHRRRLTSRLLLRQNSRKRQQPITSRLLLSIIVVERVRTADGVPVMLENNAFVLADHPYLQTLADEDLTDNSIFALVAEHSGRAPLKSDPCTVEIALADAQAAPLLEVPVGEPLFYMEAYFTDEDERPLLLGRQKIVGSRYVFDI